MKCFIKLAFTLSEVLIALLVVGIVAAILIPPLVNKSQEMEFHSALKKSFSDLSQASKQIIQDNGGSLANVCKDTYIDQCARDWFAERLSVQKKCRLGITEGCWPNDVLSQKGGSFTQNSAALILNNGTLITFSAYATDCSYNTGTASNPAYICTHLLIDVNGFKKPNVVGKDIYQVDLTNNNLLPSGNQYERGWYRDPNGAGCGPNSSGEGCSAYYLYNND